MSAQLPIRLLSIRELAKRLGQNYRTTHWQMTKLHRLCQAGTCGSLRATEPEHKLWLFRPSFGQWSVNLSRLRIEHPERYPGPDLEDIDARLESAEEYGKHTRKLHNALAAAFREHARLHVREPGK